MHVSRLPKLPGILFAICLFTIPLSTHAADFFSGVDGAYVAWKDCTWYVYCDDSAAPYGGSVSGYSTGTGVRVGYWLSQTDDARSGVEIGYDKLGSFSGSTEWYPNGCSLPFCTGPVAITNWKIDGNIVYIDWFGYLRPKNESSLGGLLFKFGVFRSTTRTQGTYTMDGALYTREATGGGFVLGTGYVAPLTQRLSARAALDMFFGVRVANPVNASNTFSDSLFKLALGVDYTF